MVRRLTNQGENDVFQLLCHPICNGTPTGHNGSEGDANFMYSGEAIKLCGDSTGWVHLLEAGVTESSCLFEVPKSLCKFVFRFGSGVLIDDPEGTGVCQ